MSIKRFIQNSADPICITCKHFITKTKSCSIFGKKDVVTGNIIYQNALICRNDLDQCGPSGIRYEYDPRKLEEYNRSDKSLLISSGMVVTYVAAFFIGYSIPASLYT